jgi:predicted nucleotidyltransferase component of viral defense system
MIEMIETRLKVYAPQTLEAEAQALKEILQEIALYGLSTTDFFEQAAFQGGTALRILHALPRFSEDLDFVLKAPNRTFKWEKYIKAISIACKQYGVHPDILDKSQADNAVKKMFLKDDSIGKILNLSFAHHPGKKLLIKLEIDTNPPLGSHFELKFVEFPLDYSIVTQDLSSSFAGKCHALLCRNYVKGRDWYDLTWYVARKIQPNFTLLQNALIQCGPWMNQKIEVDMTWFYKHMENKIQQIDWKKVTEDVAPFLNAQDKKALNLWSIDFFMDKLSKLTEYSKL